MARLFSDTGERARYRATDKGVGRSWSGMAFVWSPAEEKILKAVRPDLFDYHLSPTERKSRWEAFGKSSEGRALRVR